MQGPNVGVSLTIPPGATITSARLVFDGVRGAIFVYQAGPVPNLIASLASVGGTDPFGQNYPGGFHVQEDVFATATNIFGSNIDFNTVFGTVMHMSPQGFFIYSGARALGNLIVSLATSAGTDPAGNNYPQGLSIFIPISGTVQQILAVTDGSNQMAIEFQTPSSLPSAPSEVAGRAQANGSFIGLLSGQSVAGSVASSILVEDSTIGGLTASGKIIMQGIVDMFSTSAPPTPGAGGGVFLWYDGTSLHAKGPSGVDVVIATTLCLTRISPGDGRSIRPGRDAHGSPPEDGQDQYANAGDGHDTDRTRHQAGLRWYESYHPGGDKRDNQYRYRADRRD